MRQSNKKRLPQHEHHSTAVPLYSSPYVVCVQHTVILLYSLYNYYNTNIYSLQLCMTG